MAQIEQVFMSHQDKLISAKVELEKRELQLKTLMQADPIQEAQARKAIEQIAMARAELEKANASMMLSIRKNLSKEQWNKLDTIQNSQYGPVTQERCGREFACRVKADAI